MMSPASSFINYEPSSPGSQFGPRPDSLVTLTKEKLQCQCDSLTSVNNTIIRPHPSIINTHSWQPPPFWAGSWALWLCLYHLLGGKTGRVQQIVNWRNQNPAIVDAMGTAYPQLDFYKIYVF